MYHAEAAGMIRTPPTTLTTTRPAALTTGRPQPTPEQTPPPGRNKKQPPLILRRDPITARETLDTRCTRNAARDLETLPAAGATWHLLSRQNWAPWDLTSAILRIKDAPAVEALYVTYSYTAKNIRQLFGLIDEGRLQTAYVVTALVMTTHTPDLWNFLATGMAARGQHNAAHRVHAKIQALQFADGTAYIVEGSANLSASRSIEQITITHDENLYDFHAAWIREICRAAAAGNQQRPAAP
jgi:hypothetical protein